MAQPRQTSTWPLAGERQTRCTLQFATPTTDAMGGRGEPVWTDFGTWWAKVTVVPIVPRFNSGVGIRIVTPNSLTLKVFQIENPLLKNRTLVAHCANATNTQ
jgi:hypothetical protein